MALSDNPDTPGKHTGFTFRGKEIVLSKTKGRPFTGLVKKGMEKGLYTDEKRIEAVTLYAALGNPDTVSELCSVPAHTIRVWRKEQWFQDLLREIWAENNEKIDAKFTAIVEKSLEAIQDRLENGDVRVLKDGKIVRVPISAKDLSLVSAINVDKRQLLRGLPTSRSESIATVGAKSMDRLERLAETFENLARLGRKSPQTLDITDAQIVETTDALPNPEVAETSASPDAGEEAKTVS